MSFITYIYTFILYHCCILCASEQMYVLDIQCFINLNYYYHGTQDLELLRALHAILDRSV